MVFNLKKRFWLFFNIIYDSGSIYPSPLNLTYWWNYGFIALLFLVSQILTGIFLAMYFQANIDYAFFSIEYLIREINFGWLLRYIHSNGASFFFLAVFIHLFRGFYYGGFCYPRERIWMVGIIIFFIMIMTAFLGYVLPWGQMSFWAATVITNVISAVPFFNYDLVQWIWGGFSLGNATLIRFYSFHYLLPFVLVSLVIIHIIFLHEYGSNNPVGLSFFTDSIVLGPSYIIKDLYGYIIMIIFFFNLVFFFPDLLGHSDNYIMANSVVTPSHIVPEWYFWPLYAILRAVSSKLIGVILLLMAIFSLLFLPFFYKSFVRSIQFLPHLKIIFWIFIGNVLILGWIGGQDIDYPFYVLGQFTTLFYFSFFFFFLPILVELIYLFFKMKALYYIYILKFLKLN